MSKKGLIILVICFLVIAMAVGAGLFLFWGKVSAPMSETAAGTEEAAGKKDAKVKIKAPCRWSRLSSIFLTRVESGI